MNGGILWPCCLQDLIKDIDGLVSLEKFKGSGWFYDTVGREQDLFNDAILES